MKYIKVKELKNGMRTAKPIYSEEGVLLYMRNTIVTDNVISSVKRLDLYGMYILEPTEPLPPITEEEEEFEKFQTVMCYALKKEHNLLLNKEPFNVEHIAQEIISRYGHLKKKISYVQTIRSNEDYPYKHMLSVAILCAIMCNKLGIEEKEKLYIVSAALIHDIGKLIAPPEIISKEDKLTAHELRIVREADVKGFELIKNNTSVSSSVRRYLIQLNTERCNKMVQYPDVEQKLLLGTKIMQIADMYDLLTAMRVYKEPTSEFSAIKFFQDKGEEYDENIVIALMESINILPIGACVELTNGEKGLIIAHSEYYLLRPKVLGFKSNTIYDLSQRKTFDEIKIKDILKTMDNRFVMKEDTQ